MKTCIRCAEEKCEEDYYFRANKRTRFNLCKVCARLDQRTRYMLKICHPAPDKCQDCGCFGRLEIEHDHTAYPLDSYRGHTCHSCNLRREINGVLPLAA